MKRMLMILLLITLLTFMVGCASGTTDEPAGDEPAEDVADEPADTEEDDAMAGEGLDAEALIANNCTSCHGDAQIYRERDTDRWPGIVSSMAARTSLNEEETETILVYLQENYSK